MSGRKLARVVPALGFALFLGACSGVGTVTHTGAGTIGEAGGMVESADGAARVHVPPSSGRDDVEVRIEPGAQEEIDRLLELAPGALFDEPSGLPIQTDDLTIGSYPDYFWLVDVPMPSGEPLPEGSPDPGVTLELDLVDLDQSELWTILGINEDGEVVVPQNQRVDRTEDGVTVSGTVTEAGTYAAFGGTVSLGLSPDHVTTAVGRQFVARVTARVHPDFYGDLDVALIGRLRGTGSPNVGFVGTLTENHKLEKPYYGGDSAGMGGVTEEEPLELDLVFECVAAGRGNYGVRGWFELAGSAGDENVYFDVVGLDHPEEDDTAWRTGVVDCVRTEDHDSIIDQLTPFVAGVGSLPNTTRSPSPTPTPMPTPAVADLELEEFLETVRELTGLDLSDEFGGIRVDDGLRARLIDPGFATLEVGESLSVEYQVVVDADAPGGTLVVAPASEPVIGVPLVSDDGADDWEGLEPPVQLGGYFGFRCTAPGVTRYGVDLELWAGPDAPEPMSQVTVLGGIAVCDDEGSSHLIPPRPPRTQMVAGGDAQPLPPTLDGPCEGQAEIPGHGTIDPSVSGGVYTVPRKGTADYFGWIDAPPDQRRSHNGRVELLTPPGFPSVTLGQWSGEGTENSSTGTTSWDLNPTWTPAGVELPVTALHNDTAGFCTANVLVTFEGGLTDSPLGPASLGLTLLGLGGLGFAGVPRKP